MNVGCREIWRLYQKSTEEKRRELNGSVYAKKARKNRGNKQSEYEIAAEELHVSKFEDFELKLLEEMSESDSESPVQSKTFQRIFPDEITIRAALQSRALTLRQVCLLKAYLDTDDALPNRKRWEAIGRRIGRSGKTVEREFQKLVAKFLRSRETNGQGGASIKVVYVRGERKPRYYHIRSIQIGEWRRVWSELITEKKLIRELRRQQLNMIRSEKVPVPSSAVNRLFGALIRYYASDLAGGDVRPYGMSACDWEYNLRWAERLLKRKSPGPWTALEVYHTLVRGARLCRGCRTFLIRGFRIHGSKITRAREYCDDACKMRAARWESKRHQLVCDQSDAVARS
jgi:hypothetical protein